MGIKIGDAANYGVKAEILDGKYQPFTGSIDQSN